MKVVPGCQELLATLQVVPDNSLTLMIRDTMESKLKSIRNNDPMKIQLREQIGK